MNAPRSNDFVWYNTFSTDFSTRPRKPQPHVRRSFKAAPLWLVLKRLGSALRKVSAAWGHRMGRHMAERGWTAFLPWIKGGTVAVVFLIVLNENVSFHVRQGDALPGTATATRAVSHQPAVAGASLQPEWPGTSHTDIAGGNASEAIDFFADAPTDDAETRRAKSYIRRFRKVARAEMKKFGIPASVKMAQALVESRAGTSRLARENNNHFGIKCFSKSCKKGHCSNFGDDHHKDFFRIYPTAWESWRAHSLMLTQGRYRKLLDYGTDYRKWAYGLKELGYATDPSYAETLIRTIEEYQLWRLDR